MPGLIEFCTPDFVQRLVLGPPEGYWRSKPNVEVAEVFERIHQSFGVQDWSIPPQSFD